MIGDDVLYRVNGVQVDKDNLPPKELIRSIRIATGAYSAEFANRSRFMVDIFTDPTRVTFGGSFMTEGTTTALSAQNPFAPEKAPYDEVTGRASLHGHLGKKFSYSWSLGRFYSQTGSIVNAQVLNSSLEQTNFRDAISAGNNRTSFDLSPTLSLGERDNLVGYWGVQLSSASNLGVGELNLPEHSYRQRAKGYTARITYNHSFSKNINNELDFSYGYGLKKQHPLSIDPEVLVTGAFAGGGNSIGNSSTGSHDYLIKDVLRIALNKRLLAIGVEAHDYANNNTMANNFNGTFTFSSLSAYQITRQGIASGLTPKQIRQNGGGASQFQITAGRNQVSVSEPDIAGFVQDNIDVLPNVGISYGVRIEAQRSLPGVNVAPRFSVSWGIDGSEKKPAHTSLQASVGIFYNRFPLSSVAVVKQYQKNQVAQYTYTSPDFFPYLPQILEGEANGTPSSYGLSSRLHASYMTREDVSLSRRIGKEGRLNVMFFHSLGQRQYNQRNINAPLPGTFDPNDPNSGIRPLGTQANIFQYESEAMNKGSEVAVYYMGSLLKHVFIGGGMGFNVAKGDDFGPPSNPYSLKDDYGRSTSKRPYGSFTATIEIPKVFTLEPSMWINGGETFNITLGKDLNGDTIYNDRPSFATNPDSPTVVKTKYGNFETNPGPDQKRIPVNFANAPVYVLCNLSISRDLPLQFLGHPGGRSKPSLNFSADGNNILNHVNLSAPVGSLSSPLFGKSLSTTSDSRDFRFHASVRF